MSVIWWTLYILGALTILIIWINLMALLGRFLKVVRDKEWKEVKVFSGPPGPAGPKGDPGSSLTRKDIESLIRMEVAANLSQLEISRTTFPGLGTEETKIKMNNNGGWYADKHKRHSDEEDK